LPALTEDESLQYAADERVVFASEHEGRNHLYAISSQGGTPTLLTPGNYDVEDVALSQDKKSIIYSSNQFTNDPKDEDRRHLWRVNIAGGAPQQLTRGETMEWSPVEMAQGHQVVCLGSTATTPAMPYRVTASGGRELLGAIPPDFPSRELVIPEQVTFKSEDGLTIHGQLFVPRNRAPGSRAPALIFTHGGPIRQMMLGFHYFYYYHNAYAENQYLAGLGYVVLSVNYRLGIMYGRDFREAPNSAWRGSAEYKDVLAGGRYLQSLSYVDPKRIGLWGGSYGGLLTALGLARNSDVFAAGVDFHGVHDWSVFLPEWEDNATKAPDYDAAVKLAFQSSPVASVAKWRSPVLLIHGDDDRNVPFSQTTDLVQRLRRQGVEFEELIFPDDIHDFLLWKDWIRAYSATAEFFDRRLKNTSSPAAH
jgi:dipeptidyl aminopeptidase/acylaminoacyl peptidase